MAHCNDLNSNMVYVTKYFKGRGRVKIEQILKGTNIIF